MRLIDANKLELYLINEVNEKGWEQQDYQLALNTLKMLKIVMNEPTVETPPVHCGAKMDLEVEE